MEEYIYEEQEEEEEEEDDDDDDELIDERELIDLIKANPVVYDPSHPKHKRVEYRSAAWRKIANQLNTTVALCKNRWKTMRHVLKRDFTTQKRRKYYLREALEFYVPFLNIPGLPESRDNNKVTEYELEKEDATSSWQTMQPVKLPPLTRIPSPPQMTSKTEDVDQGFLFSILPDLETLSPRRKRIFKEKVVSWLRELHDEMDAENAESVQHEYIIENSTKFEYVQEGDESADMKHTLHDHIY